MRFKISSNTINDQVQTSQIQLTPFDNRRLVNLCGRLDEHLKLIEERLSVDIINRGNKFKISGVPGSVAIAQKVLKLLYKETQGDNELTPNNVHLAIQQLKSENTDPKTKSKKQPKDKNIASFAAIKTPLLNVAPRNTNQANYVKNIAKYDVNFGVGPAGTGKTFIAVATAVEALESQRVKRILLVRPVVEAGESLGFLPGDLAQKIDPYLRPLYDALHEMLGFNKVISMLEQQVIEIAPLAYMRGRTLNDAFIILDESQNTTVEQMKMFLTRIGFSSTAVITGDVTQVDLPKGKKSGLKHAIEILDGIKTISFNYFDSKDVVRHPIVQEIIDAYDKAEKNKFGDNS